MRSCAICERVADVAAGEPPLGWSTDVSSTSAVGAQPTTRWICPACTREFSRSIEAKLDTEYW